MPAYPSSVKTFSTKVDLVDINFADHINDLQKEVVAIETILGLNPQGSYSTVRERLEGTETGFASSTHTHSTDSLDAGTLGVVRGGTGRASITAGSFMRGEGANAVSMRTPTQVRSDINAAAADHTHSSIYAPLHAREQVFVFSREGTLAVTTSGSKLLLPWNGTVVSIQAALGFGAVGNTTVRLTVGGSFLETTIPDGSTTGPLTSSSLDFPAGTPGILSIEAVGSSPGEDLTVIANIRRD